MNIKLSVLLIHVLYPIIIYVLVLLLYRYVIHSDYRWNQKGNICYDNARETSFLATFIISIILGILYHLKDIGINIIW